MQWGSYKAILLSITKDKPASKNSAAPNIQSAVPVYIAEHNIIYDRLHSRLRYNVRYIGFKFLASYSLVYTTTFILPRSNIKYTPPPELSVILRIAIPRLAQMHQNNTSLQCKLSPLRALCNIYIL